MNIIYSTIRKSRRMLGRILSIFAILAIAFPATQVAYAVSSPFVGNWEATDADGSDIRLMISGPPSGPFQITSTDSYISFCDGESGIIRGTGQLNDSDPNLLETDLHLECFTTGASLDFRDVLRYHPNTNTLSSRYENGMVTIWHQAGRPPASLPPLYLRVNYGHDWVESFYEGEHTVWVTVTDSDANVKATTEAITDSNGYFQTQSADWLDADGNPMEYPPDIQPNDWVYGWVDNGANAQVQIGDISGTIDLETDSIQGTVSAPWYSEEVGIECHSWGAPLPEEILKYDTVQPNSEDTYSCSWAGEWNIQPGQDVGVAYFGPDGHWVANAFRLPPLVLYIHYEYPDVVEGEYELGHSVQVTVFDSDGNTKATASLTTMEMPHWGGAPGFRVEQWDGIEGPPDLQPGDVVRAVVDNGLLTTEARIGEIAAEINADTNSITGTINVPWAGEIVNVLCMPWGGVEGVGEKNTSVVPDGISEFTCAWDSEWDIQPGDIVGVAYSGDDLHSVANGFVVPNPRIVGSESGDWFWTSGFNPGPLNLFIYESTDEGAPLLWSGQQQADQSGFMFVGSDIHGKDLVPGNYLVVSDGVNSKGVVLETITMNVFDTENEIMAGTAPSGREVMVVAGMAEAETQASIGVSADLESGAWMADFSTIPFDITEEMRPWSFAQIYDKDGDANEAGTPPPPPPARIVVQITDDWFRAENFAPNTSLNFAIYSAPGGNLLFESETLPSDANGEITTWVGDRVDLVPGDYVVVSDGITTRSIVLEALTFDVFDTSLGILRGTAPEPFGRAVSVGIGCWERDDLTMDVFTSENGDWIADYGVPVPNDFGCVYAQVFDLQGNASEVRPSRILPMLFAWLDWDEVNGHGWREGETITLTIGDLVFTQVATSPSVTFDVGAAGYDIKVGDLIQMSDGLITKELQIPRLGITDYNLGANTISGFYDPSLGFHIAVSNQEAVDVVFDGNMWTAYFADLQPLEWGGVNQRDTDSDEVSATIRTPNPTFYVVPDEERIYASEWSPEENLIVSVNGQEVESQVIPNSGSPYGPEVTFDVNGKLDLHAGQVVSLTDGRSTKDLIVATLQVTGFDLGTHTIFGIADPGPLFIGVNGEDMWTTVGEDGTWEASSPNFDPLEWGSVIKTDDDGDQTRDIFMIPRPMMYAFADDNVVTGVVWTEGQPLTLKVYDSASGDLAYERTEIVPPPSVVPWTVVNFYLGDAGYDLKPGDRLVMSQNGYERELILSSLQIIGFDLTTKTMFGTGDAGAQFYVHINGERVWGEVDSYGNWAISHPQLTAGVWGEAVQTDVDGDETRDGFQAPYE